jgi:two-component system sensor histidine kinase KdpD
MRGNLLRAVSHDIRTPLTSIVGSASGVLDNYNMLPEERVVELVTDIKEEAQWLIRIVENLLSVTRINGENAKIKTEEEIVEEIVSSAVIKFRKRFPDIEVSVEAPEDFLMVPMDGILIEQVLVNLLENAALHGKTLKEICIIIEHVGERLIFHVQDDGVGIEESVLPNIFEGNLQPREGLESDSKKNMGIGLSVCMSIVKAHKGNMKAENIKGGGAKFTFWLPMKEENYGY